MLQLQEGSPAGTDPALEEGAQGHWGGLCCPPGAVGAQAEQHCQGVMAESCSVQALLKPFRPEFCTALSV